MPEKPTYEDLKQKVDSLQNECAELARTIDRLRDNENKYRTFFENSLNAMFITRPDGIVLEANAAACEMFGYTEEELIREGRNAIVDPEDPRLLPALKERERKGRFAGELILKRKDGEKIPAEITSVIFRTKDGDERASIIVRNISERKRAEKALGESEAFTRTIMDSLPIGVAVNSVDPSVDFLYMNDNFPGFYRTTREALSDPDVFWDVVYEDPAFREEIRKRVLEDCASNDPARMHWDDVPITRQGEETSFINARNIALPEKSLMISTVWDVTDRRRAEAEKEKLQAQLQQATKMEAVGRLAGGVAHDFNNLLTVITGYSELLLQKVEKESPMHREVKEIKRAGERAASLTQQLLAFSRKQIIEPRVVRLDLLVAEMHAMLPRLIGEDIALQVTTGKDLGSVKIDPGQFQQILMNLAVNARDAMPDGGKIVIETSNVDLDEGYCALHPYVKPGRFVMLAVSDTGQGMSEEVKAHIFEPFFTTKEQGKGTGLGLAMTYGAVKQSGGSVEVYSEAGIGTTFKIYLPRVEGEASPSVKDDRPEDMRGGSETVLLVEDEDIVRNLCVRILERLGYKVLQARNGAEAIVLAQGYGDRIDLLLTDVVMPGMNGAELARQLVLHHPEGKVLFTSGYTDDAIVRHGILKEGVSFIGKPYTPSALAKKVRGVLDR